MAHHHPPDGTTREPSSVRCVVATSLVGTSLESDHVLVQGIAAALDFDTLCFRSSDPLRGRLSSPAP